MNNNPQHNDSNEDRKEAKIQEQIRCLENLQNSQSVFLKNLSQNIRIPLNGIIGMIDVMKMTQINEEQADYLNIINKYGDQLIVIVNDILDYSKIIADELVFDQNYFSPNSLIKRSEQSFRIRIEGKGLEYKIINNNELPPQIFGDQNRIYQILSSLINNSIKFTRKGYIQLSVSLIDQKDSKSRIRFIIEDTGYGMPSSKEKQIRAELYKPTKEISISTDGIGLGMSISQALLRLMNSELQFETTSEQGSKFWFDLDFESKITTQSSIQQNRQENNRSLNILLVEDNVLNQKFATATLQKSGHSVILAENGQIAYEKYKKNRFDLILMDIQMPVMDGVEATINIRNWEKKNKISPVKIVAVTAYAMDRDRNRCLNSGMDKFLAKPFKPEELIHIIDNLEFS